MTLRKIISIVVLALAVTAVRGQLQHHYSFDAGATDSAGSTHGTLQGNAFINTGGGNPVGGGYLDLDGSGDWVDFGASILTPASETDNANVTISGWIRLDTDYSGGLYGESNARYTFYVRADKNNINLDQYPASGGAFTGSPDGSAGFSDNAWHHVAYVQDTDDNQRIFFDGVQIYTKATPERYTGATPTSVQIGARGNGSTPVNGAIDDMAFWHEALTVDEIKCLYDVAVNESLDYDAGEFEQLKQVHDAGSGSATLGNMEWTYATGLTDAAGLSGSNPSFTLVLDAAADTGLTSAIIEPIIWNSPGASNITATSAWVYATVSNDVDGAVLVWDTTDQGTSSTNAWPNRVWLGSWNNGDVITGQMTGLLEKTSYRWRFFAFNSTANGWLAAQSISTLDITPPTIQTLSPVNGATDVNPCANLVATFNETIVAGTGNIVVTNLTDGTAMTIPVADAQVTINGATLTINPSGDLSLAKQYAVLLDAGAVKDTSGNAFAGISAPSTWSFATFDLVMVSIVNPSAATGNTNGWTAASAGVLAAASDGDGYGWSVGGSLRQSLPSTFERGTYVLSVDVIDRPVYDTGWDFGLYYDDGGLQEVVRVIGGPQNNGSYLRQDAVVTVNPGDPAVGKNIVVILSNRAASYTSDWYDNVRLWGPKSPPQGTVILVL